MPDWKFYVTSLVAVFLALGIGILVGSMLVGDEAVLSQQSSMLAQLEADLVSLREANSRLRLEAEEARRDLERARAVASQVLPHLLSNKLEGTAVALVSEAQNRNSNLKQALIKAGAALSFATLDGAKIPWAELAPQLGFAPETPPGRLAQVLGEYLGRALAGDGRLQSSLLEPAGRRGWWIQELSPLPAKVLVIVDGGEANHQVPERQLLLSLARYWHNHCGPVVATGPGDERSLAPYERIGALTVPTVQDPWSQAQLITTLSTL